MNARTITAGQPERGHAFAPRICARARHIRTSGTCARAYARDPRIDRRAFHDGAEDCMTTKRFQPKLAGQEHIVVYRDGPRGLPIAITWLTSGDIYDMIQAQPRSLDDRRMPRKPIARLIAELGHDIRRDYDYIPDGEILAEPVEVVSRIPIVWTF